MKPGQHAVALPWQRTPAQALAPHAYRKRAAWLALLLGVLVAEGVAVTQSVLWAAPLVALLVVAVAVDVPLLPFLALVLPVRILTDASLSSEDGRHSGSLNLSSAIAIGFVLIAIGLLLRRRRNVVQTLAVALFLCAWTGVAIRTNGASAETVREGVRELSVLSLGVIVCNSAGRIDVRAAIRLVQLAGVGAALVALYQLATHSGPLIAGQIRSNGTFDHPDGAAMYFAIATTASLWMYTELGRKRRDLVLTGLFAAATISTFSITGLASLLAMVGVFGTLRPGSARLKLGLYATAALVMVAFVLTPLGSERISQESSSKSETSLSWRFNKWSSLIPIWESAPVAGRGLGTTVTAEGNADNLSAGLVPHNEYLRYLVETGVTGLAIVLLGLWSTLRALKRRRRSTASSSSAILGTAVLVGCMVNSLADNTLLYTTTGYAAALILAAVLSAPTRIAPARAPA